MQHPVRVGLVYGSTRAGRFCDTVTDWEPARIATRGGYEIMSIDPLYPGLQTPQRTVSPEMVRAALGAARAAVPYEVAV